MKNKTESSATDKTIKKNAFFIFSSKGGVGKTTFAKALTDVLRYNNDLNVDVFDTDVQVMQLAQTYGHKSEGIYDAASNEVQNSGVQVFDIKNKQKGNHIINILDDSHDNVLIDFPGGVMNELNGSLKIRDIKEAYLEEGFDIWVFYVITGVLAASKEYGSFVEAWGEHDPRIHHLVVKNTSGFDPEQVANGVAPFIYFEGERSAKNAFKGLTPMQWLQSRQGDTVIMPEIMADTFSLLDGESTPFFQVPYLTETKEEKAIWNRIHRNRVAAFMKAMNESLSTALSPLNLKPHYESPGKEIR